MIVKELKKLLEKFDDDDEILIEQEYNSNGGICHISNVAESKYEKDTVVIEGKFWW